MIGIYKLVFENTDKVYIGKSEDLHKREKEHRAHMLKGTHSLKMNEAYAKFGMPRFEILCECLVEELDEFEEETIDIYNAVDDGFNTLYKAGDTPDNTGVLNGMSKYPKKLLLRAFSLLYRTNKTLLDISNHLNIQISTLSSISNGYRHLWLKTQYPDKYALMLTNRRTLIVNSNTKYPEIQGPDGTVYQISNVKEFCRQHPLLGESGCTHLNAVMLGKRKQHKGFKLCNIEDALVKKDRATLVDPNGVEYVNISNITKFCSEHPFLAGNLNARKGISRVFNKERESYLGFHLKRSARLIYKYRVRGPAIVAPLDSRFLHAAYQNDEMYVWVELGKLANTKFEITYVGTGWDEDTTNKVYLATLIDKEAYMWHIFYEELK